MTIKAETHKLEVVFITEDALKKECEVRKVPLIQ